MSMPSAPVQQYPIDPNGAAAGFAAFWAAPDPALLPGLIAPDAIAYWPPGGRLSHGVAGYQKNITLALDAMPDLRLEIADHAVNGDLTFVRWIARATGPDGPIEFDGFDRIRVNGDGLVVENVIRTDMGYVSDLIGKKIDFT